VRGALRRTRRVLLQRPTGTGKTVLFCAITGVVTEGGAQTLILQHREELIGQTSRTLTEMAVEHGIIDAKHPRRAAAVQIASIDTMARRLGAYQPGDFKPVFVDEAHLAAAPSWQRVIDHFAEAYVIGCTATPERLDGKGLDHLFGELVAGRSVKEYVELGVLVPAVTFAPPEPPDLSGIRRRLGDFEQTALPDRMSDSAIVGDAIEHYKHLSPQVPGLVYCCPVRHSQLVAEAFSAAGYAARHVDGETPATEREATIDALHDGKLDLVTNVALFTEGLDVPLLGIVVILRPTESRALHLQMLGRVTRTARGKRRGLILDHAGNSLRHDLYDFDHQWSLKGRPKKSGERLVRRCPECGAMLPIKAQSCSECGYQFVVQMRRRASPRPLRATSNRSTTATCSTPSNCDACRTAGCSTGAAPTISVSSWRAAREAIARGGNSTPSRRGWPRSRAGNEVARSRALTAADGPHRDGLAPDAGLADAGVDPVCSARPAAPPGVGSVRRRWPPCAGDRGRRPASDRNRYRPASGLRPLHDFRADPPPGTEGALLVTNPPWDLGLVDPMIGRGLMPLDSGALRAMALLLRPDKLFAASRAEAFSRAAALYQCCWRPIWVAGSIGNPRWAGVWVVWRGDHPGPPVTRFLRECDLAQGRLDQR